MNLEAMNSLEGMAIIVLVIAAVGAAVTHLFRNAESPYLITISGTKAELFVFGALVWLMGLGIGVAVLLIVSAIASPMVGVAIFFGVEAVALDICAHRTRYVQVSCPIVEHARVRVTLPFGS